MQVRYSKRGAAALSFCLSFDIAERRNCFPDFPPCPVGYTHGFRQRPLFFSSEDCQVTPWLPTAPPFGFRGILNYPTWEDAKSHKIPRNHFGFPVGTPLKIPTINVRICVCSNLYTGLREVLTAWSKSHMALPNTMHGVSPIFLPFFGARMHSLEL